MSESCWEIISARYTLAILASVGMGIVYGLKVNLSVAMVSMINHTASISKTEVRFQPLEIHSIKETTWLKSMDEVKNECDEKNNIKDDTTEDGPFLWSGTIQGILLSSYFWGYMIAQIPGGRIAELVSAKWVMFFAVSINVLCTLLSPVAAKIDYSILLIMRVAEGVGGGVTFPAMHVMLARWSPPVERTFITSITYAGTSLGTVIFTLGSGVIASKLGWEAIFYIEGALSAIWLFLWAVLTADSPRTHRFISQKEREFIIKAVNPDGRQEEHDAKKESSIPWKSIMTSSPFIAILVAHVCSNFGFYMTLIELPLYMKSVLKFRIATNAVLSSIPFFCMWLFSLIIGKILAILQANKIISTTTTRKIATLISCLIPAICFALLGYIGCRRILATVLMSIAVATGGAIFCGFLTNHIDIAPNFAGTLIGITNTAATIPGIVVPIMVGKLTQADPSITSWRIVFFMTIIVMVIEAIVYGIFASGNEQEWNKI